MSPTFNDSDDPRHGLPRTQSLPGNGYDLLNSLVSPGPTTPIQPDTAWPGLQGWEAPMQGFFSQAMQFPGQIQFAQPGFLPNVQQDYIPFGDNTGEEDADALEVNPTFDNTAPAGAQPVQDNVMQDSNMDQSSLAPKAAIEKKTVSPSQADSQKKLVELRAKLLANRPRSAASQRSNTPSKSKELPIQPKSTVQEHLKETASHGNNVQDRAKTVAPPEPNVNTQEPSMNADIDILLAEGRNAANGKQQVQQKPASIPKPADVDPKTQKLTSKPPSTSVTTNGKAEEQNKDTAVSSDEEGEIRGEPVQSASPDRPYKSIESRQDTTTEAQEKIDRQVETKSAYGALKNDPPKTAKSSAEGPKGAPKSSETPKAKPISPRNKREYVDTRPGKPAIHDNYRPSRGDPNRDGDQERRTYNSTSQSQQDRIRRLEDLLSMRDQEIADLKSEKENLSRQLASQGPIKETTQAQNGTEDVTEAAIMSDRDLADWMEMTEYYDDEYRERRLIRFRKKKELDAERAELEREDQMDLEERNHRAHTAVPSPAFSPKVLRRASIATTAKPSRMPPPPLPLQSRESSDRVGDIAPLSQASTPTLKRQHAELDTDVQPAEKFVRTTDNGIRTRGSSPTNSFKGEPLSARFPPRPPPLEERMTRRGSDFERRAPPRRRSPSPGYSYRRPDSRERRRSFSPRPRFRAPPRPSLERPYQKPCYKCNKLDHQQKDCPLIRRDSKDNSFGFDEAVGFPVSQNYMGRNPLPVEQLINGAPPPNKQLTY